MPKQDVDILDLIRRSGLVDERKLVEQFPQLEDDPQADIGIDADAATEQLIEAGLITSWQAEKLLAGRHKGFFLSNKYKLLDHLGTGGMSSVYLAEHVVMGRRVAIKVLPQSKVDDSSYLARFMREARAGAMEHPNIVRTEDIDNDGKTYYLIMEHVDGRNLEEVVTDNGVLDYDLAANYILQAARGLAHAHDANLVHRDIKPSNLLVDSDDRVKILDLGLALITDDSQSSLTIAHDENVLGTADYLAPEQALNSHNVDHRADIYSLGGTLYYLLTGHPPFPEGTLTQRLMMHQTRQPKSIIEDRPDAPRELVQICNRMMAKKPQQRYPTAQAVVEALEKWIDARKRAAAQTPNQSPNQPPSQRPPRPGSHPGRPLQARPPSGAGRPPAKSAGGPSSGVVTSESAYPRRTQSASDTVSGSGYETVKGPPASRPPGQKTGDSSTTAKPGDARKPAGGSSKILPKAKPLPRAKPIDDSATEPSIEDFGLPGDSSKGLEGIDDLAAVDTPAAAPSSVLKRIEKEQPKEIPWVWIVAGSILVGLILLGALIYVAIQNYIYEGVDPTVLEQATATQQSVDLHAPPGGTYA